MRQDLFIWNWIGGGFNQTYATGYSDAIQQAKKIWPEGKIDRSTLKRLNRVEEREYWKNFMVTD